VQQALQSGECANSRGKMSIFYTICFQITFMQLNKKSFSSGCIVVLCHVLPHI